MKTFLVQTRALCVAVLLLGVQLASSTELSAQDRPMVWDSASLAVSLSAAYRQTGPVTVPMGRATGGGLVVGTALGALAGFGYGLYACAQAGEGAICLPGYVVFTLGGAAAGFFVSLIIMTGRS